MFRRSKTAPEPTPVSPAAERAGGKGRPTPTRREAEAANRARARAARNPKAAKGQARAMRTERSQEVRARMKAGDERYLLPRDRGPVRRFVRDYVDSRLSVAEFAMPLMIVSLLAQVAGAAAVGVAVLNATMLVLILESVWLRFRIRREVRARFGAEHLKGVALYAFARALQLRVLRIPKSQRRIGDKLPEHYPQP